MAGKFKKFIKKLLDKKEVTSASDLSVRELEIPQQLAESYAAIIARVLPYFDNLDQSNKQRFLKRVYNFRNHKQFHFSGMEGREEIAVLVSAAAVQISFGLQNYLLPFFRNIHIVSDAYVALDAKELYIGHVSPTGIYISWKHFVQGFSDYKDGVNVAIHEMAHALHHENFLKETGVDWEFREDFEKLPEVFGPLMAQAIAERKSYLRGYAFTNFHEFWAVCVEYFFEKPEGLKKNLPQLFSILCKVLNQDPMEQGNPVMQPSVSGN